jgi:hypothetical protein
MRGSPKIWRDHRRLEIPLAPGRLIIGLDCVIGEPAAGQHTLQDIYLFSPHAEESIGIRPNEDFVKS